MNVPPTSVRPIAVPAPSRAQAPAAPADAAPEAAAAPTRMRSLWDLLTPDERDFFAQQEALGPLTYARSRTSGEAPAAPVGRRIDVRG